MKTIIILLGLAVFSFRGSAQEIEIRLAGESTDVSGTVVNFVQGLNDIEGNFEIYRQFDVINLSGSPVNMKVQREKVTELEGTADYVCWGLSENEGICYPEGTVAPYNPWVAPHDYDVPNDSSGWLKVYHEPNDVLTGCVEYKYVIIRGFSQRLDSVNVKFCSTASVDELETINSSVYPNPASNLLNISLDDDVNNVSFKLFNVLGDQILYSLLNSGLNEVSIVDLPNGIYYYSILRDSRVIETKKLVIKHN